MAQDNAAGRRQFEKGMEQRRQPERAKQGEDWKELRRGWCWGERSFREQLLEMIGEKQGEHHYGEELGESAVQKAERFVQEMLRSAGWKTSELQARRKGDPIKVQIAERLRRETTMTWKWIAERLEMGHWRSVANAVRLRRR